MCGRYTLVNSAASKDRYGKAVARLADAAKKSGADFALESRYNIAPTQDCLVIRANSQDGQPEAQMMRWGLVPSWAKAAESAKLLINARVETANEKPTFRASYRRRRCLVPADGFYEWKRRRDGSFPYYFQLADHSVFHLAGIWEHWQDDAGHAIESFLLLTTQPNRLMAKIHDRMPVILQGEQRDAWLDGDQILFDEERRPAFFEPIDSELMTSRAVCPVVNNAKNDGPACLEPPLAPARTQLDLGF